MSKTTPNADSVPRSNTWTELAQNWSTCTRCSLHTSRAKVVLGAGCPGSILVLGHAPGRDEDIVGLPFQGVGGKYTHQALSMGLIPWEACFFDNCVACKAAKPLAAQIRACSTRIEDTVRIVQPKLIVSLGEATMKAICGAKYKLEHMLCVHDVWLNTPIIFASHPAELIHAKTPDRQASVTEKLTRVFQEVGSFARELYILPAE